MFRPMRRHRQQLSQWDCAAILSRGTSGVLAVAGDGGYPYAVPLSYVYQEGTLFFHCAKAGHKLDALRRCSKASFCVIDQDQVVPPGVHHLLSQRHRLRPDPYFGGRGGETSCHLAPGGEILPRRQPGASPGGHSPGGRRTVPCVALHRAHDRQAGHRAGSGRPPAG